MLPIPKKIAESPMESTTTDYVPQTESLSADQHRDLTSPSSNSVISALPDGGSDKDTAIIPQDTLQRPTHNRIN